MISLKALWDAFQKHTHTLTSLGAAAANHTHTLTSLDAAAANHTHTLTSLDAAAANHTHTLQSLGAAAANHTHPNMNKTATDVLFAGEIMAGGRGWINVCAVDVDRYFAISVTGDGGDPDLTSNTGTWYVSTLLISRVALATGNHLHIYYLRISGGYLQAICTSPDNWDNSINRVFGIRAA